MTGSLHALQNTDGQIDCMFGPYDQNGAMAARRFHDFETLGDFLTREIGLTTDACDDLRLQLTSKRIGSLPNVELSHELRSQLRL